MSRRIKDLFTEYHGRYDLANHIYSMGVDIGWRREAAREAMVGKGRYKILDIAAGTGELSIMIAEEGARQGKRVEITGMDFNRAMLGLGREKARLKGLSNLRFELGDALSMRYPDSSFDVATCAFALRNFDELPRFFSELRRVLKKDGRFVILEMAEPDLARQRFLFHLCFGVLMRPLGYLIGIDAYKWLLYSIGHFDKKGAIRALRSCGFRQVRERPLATGVGFIVTGLK